MSLNASWYSKQSAQSLIALSISSSIHLAICITLALILVSGKGNFGRTMQLDVADTETSEELKELDFSTDSLVENLEVSDVRVSLISIPTEVQIDLPPAVSPIGIGGAFATVVSDVAQAASSAGEEDARKKKTGASFFGAQADGNRFVFVIDSSGSMRGSRWQALCKELLRAIKSLSADQDFFVVSFDAVAHPMFDSAPPKGKFLKSVDKNFRRIQNWLLSIEHGSNTFPATAVGMAMNLKPDAIFLLSDGEIRDSTVEDLRVWNRKLDEEGNTKVLIPIHTVLLHSLSGYATLETIARENSGTFTPVEPH